MNLKKIAKNFTYTFTSRLVSTIISVIMVLILPKYLEIDQHSYWQLYVFYLSYIVILGLGWNDGIYLKLGGSKYNELNKPLLVSQFWLMAFVEVIFAIFFILLISIFVSGEDRTFILWITAISGFFLILRSLFYSVLEATNKIRIFAIIILLDRVIYFFLVLSVLLMNLHSYKPLILMDLITKIVIVIILIYHCRDIVFGQSVSLKTAIIEAMSNINIGIKLMLANIASSLIVGTVRWGIERQWDIQTFSKVSLTLSISSLFILLLNAVGIVMYPLLRRTSLERLPSMYIQLRNFIMVPILGMLIFFYPLKILLSAWLPQYSDGFIYIAMLLPVCVYESKMSMLVLTYLKTLRKEKMILHVNITALTLSIISTVGLVFILENLNLAVLSIFVLLVFRCILAEVLLSRVIKINVYKDITLELLLTFVFIISSWIFDGIESSIVYILLYIIYLAIKKTDIKNMFYFMKSIIKNK